MMRTLILIVFAINTLVIYAKENYAEGLFTTSKCFDLIASLQYFDKIKDAPQFSRLAADSVFMKHLNTINENVTASKLCNFYATFNGNRNDMDSCVLFFRDIHLDEKSNTESLNDFILRLFDNGTISVGSVKSEYEKAMQQIKATIM